MLLLALVLMLCGQVIVSGIPSVERAVISKEKDGKHNLLVEGTNMQAVMATAGGELAGGLVGGWARTCYRNFGARVGRGKGDWSWGPTCRQSWLQQVGSWGNVFKSGGRGQV